MILKYSDKDSYDKAREEFIKDSIEREREDWYQYYFNPTEEQKKERLEWLKDAICIEQIRNKKLLENK